MSWCDFYKTFYKLLYSQQQQIYRAHSSFYSLTFLVTRSPFFFLTSFCNVFLSFYNVLYLQYFLFTVFSFYSIFSFCIFFFCSLCESAQAVDACERRPRMHQTFVLVLRCLDSTRSFAPQKGALRPWLQVRCSAVAVR